MRIAYVNYGSQSGVTHNVTQALLARGHVADHVDVNGPLELRFRPLWLPRPTPTVLLSFAAVYLRHDIDDKLGGPSSGVFSYNRVNPRAGVNLNLSERLGFYASYSQGYRAPAFLAQTAAASARAPPSPPVRPP